VEWHDGPPIILPNLTNIWPFHLALGGPWAGLAPWPTQILYHLWWVGLIVAAWSSLPRRRRRRAMLLVPLVPAISCAASYAGFLSDADVLQRAWSQVWSLWQWLVT
jgi:hypothetical protein